MEALTFWQRIRLYCETHFPWWLYVWGGINWGVALYAIANEDTNDTLLVWWSITFLLTGLALFCFLFTITIKTTRWWYDEYPDNKWGKSRELTKELDELAKGLQEIRHSK